MSRAQTAPHAARLRLQRVQDRQITRAGLSSCMAAHHSTAQQLHSPAAHTPARTAHPQPRPRRTLTLVACAAGCKGLSVAKLVRHGAARHGAARRSAAQRSGGAPSPSSTSWPPCCPGTSAGRQSGCGLRSSPGQRRGRVAAAVTPAEPLLRLCCGQLRSEDTWLPSSGVGAAGAGLQATGHRQADR